MSVSVLFALRNAVDAARIDAGNPDWYRMGTNQCFISKSIINKPNNILFQMDQQPLISYKN